MDTPKPQNYEYSKKIKYMDMELEIVFKQIQIVTQKYYASAKMV